MAKKKKQKIMSMRNVMKKYIRHDWIYYGTPFVISAVYGAFFFNFTNLQYLVNSIYNSVLNVVMAAMFLIGFPNIATLIYCQKKVLNDLESDAILKAASSERFGGAGQGKTSSAVLQAGFEAENMEKNLTLLYYYLKSNYYRWLNDEPKKLKDFHQLEKSINFWRDHPEYIPFLGSNVVIHDANGRKSFYVDKRHLQQDEWLPCMFILIDEAGNEVPQELYKERPAGVTMFFRYIRHFGFRISLLEQKIDGVYINVRAVLGTQYLAMFQSNKLLPHLLIDILDFLKSRLKKYDPENLDSPSRSKYDKTQRKFEKLGLFVEKLENFSTTLGFRIWDGLLIKCPNAKEYVPPEEIRLYCTNKMPLTYDDREFSQLYLPLDNNPVKGQFVTKDCEAGKNILQRFFDEEESQQQDELKKQLEDLKLQNNLEKQRQLQIKLEKDKKKRLK